MPRFDFYCHHCSKKWTDVWVSSIRDAQSAPRACSVCGADMEKLPAAPNFVLKGTGFHVNDYKKGGTT